MWNYRWKRIIWHRWKLKTINFRHNQAHKTRKFIRWEDKKLCYLCQLWQAFISCLCSICLLQLQLRYKSLIQSLKMLNLQFMDRKPCQLTDKPQECTRQLRLRNGWFYGQNMANKWLWKHLLAPVRAYYGLNRVLNGLLRIWILRFVTLRCLLQNGLNVTLSRFPSRFCPAILHFRGNYLLIQVLYMRLELLYL